MALKDWTDQVEKDINTFAAKGSRMMAIAVCPAGEQTLLEANLKNPSKDVHITCTTLFVHGVPVKVQKRMRAGRFFYVLKEEK